MMRARLPRKGEQMARECVLLQRVLNQHRKPIHALPHVGLAERQVHLHAGRNDRLPLSDVPMVHAWGCRWGRVGSVDYRAKTDQVGMAGL
jgi:hypothetical protein